MSIKLHKILCPVDYSEYSIEALKYASYIAEKEEATLCLANVVDSRVYDYGGPIYEPDSKVKESMIDENSMVRMKEKLLETIPKDVRGKVETIILFGVPFVEIIKAAKDHEIDLIIMGTHGRTGLAHMLIGSVAERVVRKAPCPVLTVKKPVY